MLKMNLFLYVIHKLGFLSYYRFYLGLTRFV